MQARPTFSEKLGYIFSPREKDGTSWLDRLYLAFAARSQTAWIAREEVPEEKHILEATRQLCEKMHIRTPPKILIYQNEYPQASRILGGTMAISTGLIKLLDEQKTDAVIGHELSHHKHAGTDYPVIFGMQLLALAAMNCVVWPKIFSKAKPQTVLGYTALETGSLLADMQVMHLASLPYQRSLESRADREGAQATTPEAMAGSLEALYAHGREMAAQRRRALGKPEEKSWSEKMYESWRHFNDPHPTLEKRLSDLKKMGSHTEAVAKSDESMVQRQP